MKKEIASHEPLHHKRRFGRFALFFLIAVCTYFAWREYDFRAAIKEAEALGWGWQYDDPFDAIREDWKAAFRKDTWTDGRRSLIVGTGDPVRHASLIARLAPRNLAIADEGRLKEQSALRAAIQEAQALGWAWEYQDPLYVIHDDPEAASRKETWTNDGRSLSIVGTDDLLRHADLIARLAPRNLWFSKAGQLKELSALNRLAAIEMLAIDGCTSLTNLDALKGLPAVKNLRLTGFSGLTNIDAVKGLSALQSLYIEGSPALTNIDVLKDLPALQRLYLYSCTGLTNLDVLKRLPALQMLGLYGCTGLTNVDDLKELAALTWLYLSGCKGLTNIDGLKDLTALRSIYLDGCTGLTNVEALAKLTALRYINIIGCTGLTNIDALKGLTALRKLDLLGCTGLTREHVSTVQEALSKKPIYGP